MNDEVSAGKLSNALVRRTAEYIVHHQKVAGSKHNLFDDAAMTAIYQGSGGILRKANFLARGGLMAACAQKEQTVNAEHIRIASSELL